MRIGKVRERKMNMIQWAKIGILALTICLAGTFAQAISLGTAGDYNVFVFGDYSGSNSDVQGCLAAGGNVSLESYGVGDKLPDNLRCCCSVPVCRD
jgi:hypothetical protein